jgi:Tol biopolymer transport system component
VLTAAGGRLLQLDLDGKVTREVGRTGHQLFGAVWSPDGTHIAYSEGVGGPFADIYTAHADGSDAHQVTATPDNEIRVEWGAD